jgi:hypothetical protein
MIIRARTVFGANGRARRCWSYCVSCRRGCIPLPIHSLSPVLNEISLCLFLELSTDALQGVPLGISTGSIPFMLQECVRHHCAYILSAAKHSSSPCTQVHELHVARRLQSVQLSVQVLSLPFVLYMMDRTYSAPILL